MYVQFNQLPLIHWDISKLLEIGVNEDFLKELSDGEIRDLLKGLLYLKARYEDKSISWA
jgi:hypothetical protein